MFQQNCSGEHLKVDLLNFLCWNFLKLQVLSCETLGTKDSFQPWWTSALSIQLARNSVLLMEMTSDLLWFTAADEHKRYKVFRSAYDRFHRPPPARLGRLGHVVLDAYPWSMICTFWNLLEMMWEFLKHCNLFFSQLSIISAWNDLRFHGLETQWYGVMDVREKRVG